MKRLGTSDSSLITESTFLYVILGLFLLAFLVGCNNAPETQNTQVETDSTISSSSTQTVEEKKKLCLS